MKYGDNVTQNAECTLDAKKLINQKNYIMKHKIAEMEVEEIKRELQESQRIHLEEREEERQEHLGTIRDDEQKPNAALTTDEEKEIYYQSEQMYKLKEKKIESTYDQVTQIAIDKRPRLQKLQNMFKIKVTVKMANKAMEEILEKKT